MPVLDATPPANTVSAPSPALPPVSFPPNAVPPLRLSEPPLVTPTLDAVPPASTMAVSLLAGTPLKTWLDSGPRVQNDQYHVKR